MSDFAMFLNILKFSHRLKHFLNSIEQVFHKSLVLVPSLFYRFVTSIILLRKKKNYPIRNSNKKAEKECLEKFEKNEERRFNNGSLEEEITKIMNKKRLHVPSSFRKTWIL